MIREIKFRAWNEYDKKYEYEVGIVPSGWGVRFEGKRATIPVDSEVWVLEQYTGLKDKNGKEIYEGDIVKNIEGVNETAVCVWDESNAEFDFRCKDGKYTRDNVKSWLEMYEVIGTIHENPELLGGE